MSLSSSKDLTKGSVSKNLLRFTIPFLLAFLLQVLYGTVDMLVIGHFGGASAGVSAVASGSEVMHLIASLIMGVTTGATVLIGNFFGAKDFDKTHRCIGMTLTLSVILSVLFTAFMVPMVPTITRWLNTPQEAIADTITYSTICSWGIFFIFGYNALSAIFRGLGNSRAPLVFVAIACVINVIVDLLLVIVFKMGVQGVAIATVLSQACSMVFAIIFLYRGKSGFSFTPRNFSIDWHLAWCYAKIGIPIGTQNTMISLSFIFIFTVVNSLGIASSAAYGICNRIIGFAMLPAVAFSMSIAAITAQNIGAKLYDRAIDTLKSALAITFSLGLIALIVLQLFPESVTMLFLDPASPGAADTIKASAQYLHSFSWEFILVPFVFCNNGFFNGCGRTIFSMANNVGCTFLVRVPASYFFSTLAGCTLYEIGFAAPMASIVSTIIAIIYLWSGRWKPKNLNVDASDLLH